MGKYTIKWGDTLSGIANALGTTVDWLKKVNNILNPNKIQAGQTIEIPDIDLTGEGSDVNPVTGLTLNTTPTPRPTTDTTPWDETEKGIAALGNYNTLLEKYNQYGPFTFSLDEWAKDIDEKIKGFKDFSYDLNGDALYQQYKDQYVQQGKLAMADTMGQAAAMTGGYGNSYAQSVGQQAYQNELSNLNDIVPELYQMALNKYQMDKDNLYTEASYLMQKYAQEYGEYSDEYQQLLDALGLARSDYYDGADMYHTEQDITNTELWNQWNADETIRQDNNTQYWNQKDYELKDREVSLSEQKYADSKVTNDTTVKDTVKQPVQEPEKEPEVVTPTESENTTGFINSHMTSSEFMQRGGTSGTQSLQGGGGRSYADYKTYIKGELEKVWDHLNDSERAYLIEYYKL